MSKVHLRLKGIMLFWLIPEDKIVSILGLRQENVDFDSSGHHFYYSHYSKVH